MTATAKLGLEFLANAAANQNLANITFAQLNQLVQAGVVDKDLSSPPGSPSNEALYIVASGNWDTGSDKTGQLVYWLDSTSEWRYITPREGFMVHVNDEDIYYKYTGSAWVAQHLSGSATYDAPSIAAGGTTTTTVTVTGAALGDFALVSFSITVAGLVVTAYVSAANTVSVVLYNPTAGAINLASATLRARVLKL